MAPTSASLLSPDSFMGSHENLPPHAQLRSSGTLPRAQSVSSASMIPPLPSKPTQGAHVASSQYIEQHRRFVEHQRQLHDEERELWNLERQELYQRIQQLDKEVRELRRRCGSNVVSPAEPMPFSLNSFTHALPIKKAAHSVVDDRSWMSGMLHSSANTTVLPTRTFSDSSAMSSGSLHHENRLPSITEAPEMQRTKSVDFVMPKKDEPKDRLARRVSASIPGAAVSPHLDGINLKAAAVAPEIVKSLLDSPSPLQSPSSTSSNIGPRTPTDTLKPRNLPLPPIDLDSHDPYTKDAGHTPLARYDNSHSNTDTPTRIPGQAPDNAVGEEIPAEPVHSAAPTRPPNERSDSYFPSVAAAAGEIPGQHELTEDPALRPPYGLASSPEENEKFLSELDNKLKDVATENKFSLDAGEGGKDGDDDEKDGDGEGGSVNGEEPKLKIKRSMNFGSAFGSSRIGMGLERKHS
jgi:hypothetical protein